MNIYGKEWLQWGWMAALLVASILGGCAGDVITTPIKLVDPDAKNTPALRISATATILAAIPTRQTDTPILPSTSAMKSVQNNQQLVVDQDGRAIYALFMGNSRGKIIIVREDTFADDGLAQNEAETKKFIKTNLPGAFDETIDNYLLVSSVSGKLPANMKPGADYELISNADFLEITGDPNWREIWSQRYPNSELGGIGFSKIGFNALHTQALVYVTRLWVDGSYYLLEYDAQKGAWEIVERYTNVNIN
jgi:hypothetical protein